MLKRISVRQLTIGMHLKKFCGSWLDHPFWRSGFVITDPKDIQAVLASPIKEVWIDVSKGLDVASDDSAVSQDRPGARADMPAWKAAWKDKSGVREEGAALGSSLGARGELPAWKAAWKNKPLGGGEGAALAAGPVAPGESTASPARPGTRAELPAWKAAWKDKPLGGEEGADLAAGSVAPDQSIDSQARPGARGELPAWKAAWKDKPLGGEDGAALTAGPVAPGESTASPARPGARGELPAWKAAWKDKSLNGEGGAALAAGPLAPGESAASLARHGTRGDVAARNGTPLVRGEGAALDARPVTPAMVKPSLSTAEPRQTAPSLLSVEIQRAAKLCGQSKLAVMSMFREARMGNAIDLDNVQLLVEEISDSVARNPGALISLARLKTADDYTYMHSVAVCALMVALARQFRLDEEQTRAAGVAGLLHDLGKAMIPAEILNKPGRLTDAEFTIVKGHPLEGYKLLLGGSDVGEVALDVCLHHHEKMDGSGYPDRLKADEISLFAKMGAVCDVYDAITSNRPYKAGWDPSESLRRMAEWSGGHFDAKVFQAFVKSLGIYPIGSLVRLTSGRLGVVTEQTGQSLVNPKVKVFFSTKSNMRIVAEVIDLSQPGCAEKIVGREDPAEWRFPDLNELWSGLTEPPW